MTSRTRLSEADIQQKLKALPHWKRSDCGHFIEAEFDFDSFQEAWIFMGLVAEKAEEMDHHPNWSNVYRHVHIALTTHDADGLTVLDFILAAYCSEAALGELSVSHQLIN